MDIIGSTLIGPAALQNGLTVPWYRSRSRDDPTHLFPVWDLSTYWASGCRPEEAGFHSSNPGAAGAVRSFSYLVAA